MRRDPTRDYHERPDAVANNGKTAHVQCHWSLSTAWIPESYANVRKADRKGGGQGTGWWSLDVEVSEAKLLRHAAIKLIRMILRNTFS